MLEVIESIPMRIWILFLVGVIVGQFIGGFIIGAILDE